MPGSRKGKAAPVPPSLPPELVGKRKVTLTEVSALNAGLSEDTIRRKYSHLIIRLSDRRVGMLLSDALNLGE
jgi:hypothetical protein